MLLIATFLLASNSYSCNAEQKVAAAWRHWQRLVAIVSEGNMKGTPSRSDRRQARYANCFQIAHNAFEFLIVFGQEELTHTQIYLTPQHAQILSRLLIETLGQYKLMYEVPAQPPGVRGD